MKNVLVSLMFGAFILTAPSFAQTPPPAEPPAAATAGVTVKPMHHDHHPEIHKAMRKLRGAKQDLLKATHDYGGHRVAAIGYINQALAELQAGLDLSKTETK